MQRCTRSTVEREDEYDIAIVGGGPAGVAAALSSLQLRPRIRIAVVEAPRHDSWRAGETLAPGCQEILRGLGCWDSFRAAGFIDSTGTRAVWGGADPYDNDFLLSAHGSGWHADRTRFDALLCQAARDAGANWITCARLCGVDREQPGFRLWLRSAATESLQTLRARFVIDSSGRRASFASKCGARRVADDHLIGVCGLLPAHGRERATLVEAQADGWWYSSLLPGSRLIVAWMSDADLIRSQRLCDTERWIAHVRQSEWTRERIGGPLLGSLRAWSARSERLIPAHGDGWIAAGDAASAYDPLSSLGILKALRSGKIASFVAIDWLEGRDSAERYESIVEREYAGYCETKRYFYGQEQRWPGSPFWSRRVNGDDAKWRTVKN
ncbi:MAG: tryptophan 7-halogenase [Acidobacteriaceae bacterium]|nr:tryptophan 7-halogenase [Acidobacteriaceae bacterium]